MSDSDSSVVHSIYLFKHIIIDGAFKGECS